MGIDTSDDLAVLQVAHDATRALLRIERPEEATDILADAVQKLGGRVASAQIAGDEAVPVDLAFGSREPLHAIAPAGSPERERIERVLPSLLDDARRAAETAHRLQVLTGGDRHDVETGLLSDRAVEDILPRLEPGDSVIRIELDHPAHDGISEEFAVLLRDSVQEADHVGRWRTGFVVLLQRTDPGGAAALVARVRNAWQRERSGVVSFSAGIAGVGSDAGPAAISSAEDALQIAMEDGGGRTEINAATDGDW